jgi:membrane protein required for colicin V production
MLLLDWVFVAVLVLSMGLGAWRGLVSEVMSVANWLAAFVLAQWLATDVGRYLPMGGVSEVLRFAAGFVIVFIVVALIGGFLVWVLTKWVESSGLRRVDRALGAGFGVLRGVILLLALAVVLEMSPMKASSWWRNSVSAEASVAVLKVLKPVLPEVMAKYLP